MSTSKILLHIVFDTKHRRDTITAAHKRELYAYIFGIIRSHNCYVHRINGIANHIHILLDQHPSISVSDLVRGIKQRSSVWMRECGLFKDFDGWGDGYYASTISPSHIEACKHYIATQETHHGHHSFEDELSHIAKACDVEIHPQDLQ